MPNDPSNNGWRIFEFENEFQVVTKVVLEPLAIRTRREEHLGNVNEEQYCISDSTWFFNHHSGARQKHPDTGKTDILARLDSE